MSPKRSPFSILLVVASAFAWVAGGGVAEAVRAPSSVEVCVDSATGVVSRVASSKGCDGGLQKWSVSQSAPQLCWDGTSLDPVSRTRLVSVAPDSGCVAPLRSVPVGKVVLLCADQVSGVLRWPVTRACETGNANTWVRVGALSNAAPDTTTTTTTTAPSAALVPSVSLQATVIRANTLPKAVIVTANVAGTIYFVEGSVSVKSVKDITNAHPLLWAHGAVAAANTPTAIAIDVDKVLNGYYRVFVMTGQGVLSAPATNIVTISVPRAYETTTRVRRQTLDQDYSIVDSQTGLVVDSSQIVGQSFTAGLSGPLSRVSAAIIKSGTVTELTATLYLADNNSGFPTGIALASKTIVGTTIPASYVGLTNFDFATPYSVVAGTKYVIVLTTPDGGLNNYFGWYREDTNSNGGGFGIVHPFANTPVEYDDLGLQTYVDI